MAAGLTAVAWVPCHGTRGPKMERANRPQQGVYHDVGVPSLIVAAYIRLGACPSPRTQIPIGCIDA